MCRLQRLVSLIARLGSRIGLAEQAPEPLAPDSMNGAPLACPRGLFGEIAVSLVAALLAEEPWLILSCETHLAPPSPVKRRRFGRPG